MVTFVFAFFLRDLSGHMVIHSYSYPPTSSLPQQSVPLQRSNKAMLLHFYCKLDP